MSEEGMDPWPVQVANANRRANAAVRELDAARDAERAATEAWKRLLGDEAKARAERDFALARVKELHEQLKAANVRVAMVSANDSVRDELAAARLHVKELEAHAVTMTDAQRLDNRDLRAQRDALAEALREIARPKRGGIEANDSDEEWIEYLRGALEAERNRARAALAKVEKP